MVVIDLFLLFAHDHSTNIFGPLSFIISFVHDHSTKIYLGPYWFVSFICTRLFDQKLRFSLIYFFYLHTTIRPKYMVLFHLFFLLCTTIQPNIRVIIDLFLLFAHDHSTKMYGPLPYILSLCTIIRPKIRVLINLFLLFVHDHSTKISGHSYSLIYFSLSGANISYTVFMAVLTLYSCQYCPYISYAIFMAM